MNSKNTFLFINGIIFYTYWWLSIWGASIGNFYIGPAVAVSYFILHFIIVKDKFKEFKNLLFCVFIGFIFESILLYLGFLEYKSMMNSSVIPIWVIILWAGYSLTVFHSFQYIKGRYFLSLIIGALFAPLIHISGAKTGAVVLNYSIATSYFVLMFMWSIALPLMNYISVKFDD